jgi:hypothetical protein
MKTRPAVACNPNSRRKVVKRRLGMRAPLRSACRYASIWACQYTALRHRRSPTSNTEV